MEAFFSMVSKFTTLSVDSKAALAGILEKKVLGKGEQIVKAGTVCNHIYFVESGLTRTFYLKDGKDITDWISPEDSFACSIISFLTRKPDRRIIELLEPSAFWAIHHEALEKLYSRYHDIEKLGRLLVSFGLIQMQQRFDDLHFATAVQRYTTLIQSNPTLIQRVPLGMLASYLGITQETLSRIRSKV